MGAIGTERREVEFEPLPQEPAGEPEQPAEQPAALPAEEPAPA